MDVGRPLTARDGRWLHLFYTGHRVGGYYSDLYLDDLLVTTKP